VTTQPSFVIVGGGMAGAIAAQTLREEGFDGAITLLGQEPNRPTNAHLCPRNTFRAKPTVTASLSIQNRGTPSMPWTCR
jgi:2-polyprenyl-6-methoxyphenol hydroxylase-like FAD-dependent oxidoreductase